MLSLNNHSILKRVEELIQYDINLAAATSPEEEIIAIKWKGKYKIFYIKK